MIPSPTGHPPLPLQLTPYEGYCIRHEMTVANKDTHP